MIETLREQEVGREGKAEEVAAMRDVIAET